MGHPTGLGRLSRTFLLALARAAPDWELHVYLKTPAQLDDLAAECPDNCGFSLDDQIAAGRLIPHYPPVHGLNRMLLEDFDLPRQFAPLNLDTYLGCDFTLPPRRLAEQEFAVLPDMLPFTQPATVGWKARFLYRRGVNRCLQRRATIICISDHTRRTLDTLFTDHGCVTPVVYPALSPLLMKLAHSSRTTDLPLQVTGTLHNVKSPGPFLLSIGVTGPRKNTALLAAVYRTLVKNGEYSGSLVLTGGDGSYHSARTEPRLAMELSHPLPSRSSEQPPAIYDLGRVNDHDLSQLYRDADLLVSFSTEEGFGYPVLEALAHGTPALVTADSSMTEIARGGIAITRLTPGECHRKMVSCLGALPLLRQEAAKLPLEYYSTERLGRDLRSVLSGQPPLAHPQLGDDAGTITKSEG